MINVLNCSELLKKDSFSSYSEFFFSLCLARELGRHGYSLDTRDMTIDPDMVTFSYLDYFRYLVKEGFILVNSDKDLSNVKEPDTLVDTGIFETLLKEGKLFSSDHSDREFNSDLWWDYEFAYKNWREYEVTLLNAAKMGNVLMHLVAFWFVRRVLDEDNRSITIHIDRYKVKSTFIYVNLYSILGTLPWLSDMLKLDVDFGEFTVDLDYSIFCNNGRMMNHNRYWTVSDKKNWLKKLGIVPGSIVILWTRSRINDNNPFGRIDSSLLARVDEIGSDFLSISTMAINKTREEVRREYFSMEEDCRRLFADMLTKNPYIRNENVHLCDLGIGDYFKRESKFITRIDEQAKVRKLITLDGVAKEVEMSEVNALYWLLCQYEIDFNRQLYREMYNQGKDLLWDEFADESSYGESYGIEE